MDWRCGLMVGCLLSVGKDLCLIFKMIKKRIKEFKLIYILLYSGL